MSYILLEDQMSGMPTYEELEQLVKDLKKDALWYNLTEDALRKSEERYRRITEAVTDYVFKVRIEDGQAVETVHGSNCVAVTGYTPEDFASDPYLWIPEAARVLRPGGVLGLYVCDFFAKRQGFAPVGFGPICFRRIRRSAMFKGKWLLVNVWGSSFE